MFPRPLQLHVVRIATYPVKWTTTYSEFLYGILGKARSLTHSLIEPVWRLNFLRVGHERSSSRVHSGLCSKAWMVPIHWLLVDASTWR